MSGRVTPRETSWAEVAVHTYVVDRNGETWRVDDERDGQVLLVNAAGARTAMQRPPGAAPVTVLEPTHDEALAVVADKLGGEVVAEKAAGGNWRSIPLRHDLETIHSHMLLMHGVWTKSGKGSRNVKMLLELHRAEHLNPDERSHAWVNHTHHKEI